MMTKEQIRMIRERQMLDEVVRIMRWERRMRRVKNFLVALAVVFSVLAVLGSVTALAISANKEHRAEMEMKHAHYELMAVTGGR